MGDDSEGRKCLNFHESVCSGCEDLVRQFLDDGINPDEPDWSSSRPQPPLLLAVQRGYLDIVRLLLAANCDVNVRNSLGETALHMVVQRKTFHPGIAEILLEHSELNPNVQDNLYGYCPLHVLVKTIVASDTDVNDNNASDAALKIASTLAIAGDINVRSHRGDTPLHKAVTGAKDHHELVQLLLDSAADCDIQNDTGETPLTCAIIKGHGKSAKLLLDRGANPNIQDKFLQTGLHHAALRDRDDLVMMLLEHGCHVNMRDLYGNTALHVAAQKGYEASVQSILSSPDVDLNIRDENGESALLKAAEGGFVKVVELLLNVMDFDDDDECQYPSKHKATALQAVSSSYVKKWHPEIRRLIKSVVNSVSCSTDL